MVPIPATPRVATLCRAEGGYALACARAIDRRERSVGFAAATRAEGVPMACGAMACGAMACGAMACGAMAEPQAIAPQALAERSYARVRGRRSAGYASA